MEAIKYIEFDPRDFGALKTDDIKNVDFSKLLDIVDGKPYRFEVSKIQSDSSLWYLKVFKS